MCMVCYIIFWQSLGVFLTLHCFGLSASIRIGVGSSTSNGLNGPAIAYPAFFVPSAAIRKPSKWRSFGQSVEDIVDCADIRHVANYNQYPSYVEGNYAFDHLDLNGKAIGLERGNVEHIVDLLEALSGIKKFCLLPRGRLSLVMRQDCYSNVVEAHKDLPLTCMSDFTLALIMHAKMSHNGARDWLLELIDRDYEVTRLATLVEGNIKSVKPFSKRTELEAAFHTLIKGNAFAKNEVTPFRWRYIPAQKLAEVSVRVVPLGKVVKWSFPLLHSTKPLQINTAVLKIMNDNASPDKNDVCKLGWCVLRTLDNVGIRTGSRKSPYDRSFPAIGSEQNTTTDACSSSSSSLQSNHLHEWNRKSIFISGSARSMGNMLLKLLYSLQESFLHTREPAALHSDSIAVAHYPYPNSFVVQKLHIYLNGDYYKYIPMLVMFIHQTGTFHLCTRDVPVQQKRKPLIWNPWQRSYMKRMGGLIPLSYSGVSFAETHHFDIKKKHVEQLLTTYKPLEHIDIAGYYNGKTDPTKRKVMSVIHIDHPNQYMVNIVA